MEPARKKRKLNEYHPVAIFEDVSIEKLPPLRGDGFPFVLRGYIEKWPARKWTLEALGHKLPPDLKTTARFAPHGKSSKETECEHIETTFQDFISWLQSDATEDCDLDKIKFEENWGYLDYKHFEIIDRKNKLKEDVDFSIFGISSKNSSMPTLWIGSKGAHTPGHYDVYGFNIVAQIIGKKRWTLIPPHDSQFMYSTRIPFEESSVFTEIDLNQREKYPLFDNAAKYRIDLEPGDVLYVPHHWWHFVESLENSVSVNNWVDLKIDKFSRLKESLCRTILTAFHSKAKEDLQAEEAQSWLNPTEELLTPADCVKSCQQSGLAPDISMPEFLRKLTNILCSDEVLETVLKEFLL